MTLYTQTGCSQCDMIHRLLARTNLQYTECTDTNAAIAAGVNHTPTMEVNGKLLKGKELIDFIKASEIK